MDYAFDFITASGGLELEADYPYAGADGACDDDRSNHRRVLARRARARLAPSCFVCARARTPLSPHPHSLRPML